jgi:hypothetical protein
MRQLRRCSPGADQRRLWLAYASLILTCVPFSRAQDAASAARLFSRAPAAATVCKGDLNLHLCSINFPSNWCCSASSVCLSLNNTGTDSVICCPTSSPDGCQALEPISCDISKQNATLNPDSQLFVQDSSRQLPTCGQGACCPLGYSCSGGRCWMKEDTRRAPGPQSAAPSSSHKGASSTIMSSDPPTATITSGASATPSLALPGANSSQHTPTPQSAGDYPLRAVLAGLFPGVIIGAIVCGIIFFWLRKRSQRRIAETERDSWLPQVAAIAATGNHRPGESQNRLISEPIYNPQHSNRTHFVRPPPVDEPRTGLAPVTPQPSRWKKISPRLGTGTWDTNVPTLKEPTPPTRVRIRPQPSAGSLQYTPTPVGRSALYPPSDTPGLAVTTSAATAVEKLLKPLSPLLPAFDRGTPRSQLSKASLHSRATVSNQNLSLLPPQANTSRSRSRSNSTTTTFSSSSSTTSSRGKASLLEKSLPRPPPSFQLSPQSRHDTFSSSQTVNCLLSTAGPALVPSGIFTFQDQVNASQQQFQFYNSLTPPQPQQQAERYQPQHRRRPSQRSFLSTPRSSHEEQQRPVLGSPWQMQQQQLQRSPPPLDVVLESPISPDKAMDYDGGQGQRITNFSNLMLEAGYAHGSPARAVGRAER